MEKPVISVTEREESLRRSLTGVLLRDGCEVIESADKAGILRSFCRKGRLDLLIISSSLDAAGDGLEVARQIRQWDRRIPLILITTDSSEELAIAALKVGINDYFKHPFSLEELAASVQRCLSDSRSSNPSGQYAATTGSTGLTAGSSLIDGHRMIGESPVMQEIKAYLGKVAATDSNLLITGETGTGKELVADFIHRNSRRQQNPFVCINCAAIPDTLLESELFGYEKGAFTGATSSQQGKMQVADGGLLFFDEIGDMSPYAQAKILRAIETREVLRLGGKKSIPVDVRVIAATNQDLERLMAEDKFRKDLYFRLNVARIHLPPLRERKEDLPVLLTYYIDEMNQRFGREIEGFTDEALDYLLRYDWPGNVRELKNLVESSFINLPSRNISFMDLPEQLRKRLKDAEASPQSERARLLSALLATNWNVSKAAQKLHWSRMTLYRKIERYHIVKGNAAVGGVAAMVERDL